MLTISTLTHLRRYLGVADADTSDDLLLLDHLEAASAYIERATGRRFTPRRASITHTIGSDRTLLSLDDDLLSLESLTDGSGTIPLSDVLTLPDSDRPITVLKLENARAFTWTDIPVRAVTVTGIWGWHSAWAQAWEASGDTVVSNPLSSSATALTVSSVSGATTTGRTPRFQVGQLLKIESEYVRVLAINTGTNQLTLARGANGTTAASHVQGVAISIFRPDADIEALVVRHAAHRYRAHDLGASAPPDDPIPAGLRRIRV